ncbi:MAG TPA: SGNH/GDSL hydrolase family protein, partial [Polyangiaceae bacterium]|nr:SGNH/GDSL hydrolase family protein [Polyangiaceae bacterium]
AAHASKVQQLIERLRQAWPLAPVILTSAFASSQSGDNPYYRAAAADIAAEVDGILYLDTYGALPNYADGVAAGYYGDQVHYNATGDRALFRAIDELIVTAAQY